jgi:hypothetical protein
MRGERVEKEVKNLKKLSHRGRPGVKDAWVSET